MDLLRSALGPPARLRDDRAHQGVNEGNSFAVLGEQTGPDALFEVGVGGGRIAGGGADDRQQRFGRQGADQEYVARSWRQSGDPPEHQSTQRIRHIERFLKVSVRSRGQLQGEQRVAA
jgi:hypothetical protein